MHLGGWKVRQERWLERVARTSSERGLESQAKGLRCDPVEVL